MLQFFSKMRPEFLHSVQNLLRTRKETFKKKVDGIPIPSPKLFSPEYIAALFIQYGRIPRNIDVVTFKNRAMVECEDGEVWTARLNLAESGSVFVLHLPAIEYRDTEPGVV